MEPISVENLKIGTEYIIEVTALEEYRQLQINAGENPDWNSFTFGEYLGKEIVDNPDYLPEDDEDYRVELFVIKGADNIKIKHGMSVLRFMRPKNFDPWGRNIVMDNVVHWINDRKWRPKRQRELEIPEDSAKELLSFYEKKNTETLAMSDVFNQSYGVNAPHIAKMITSYNSGGKNKKKHKQLNKKKYTKKNKKNTKNTKKRVNNRHNKKTKSK
jgi:hypothetical protein